MNLAWIIAAHHLRRVVRNPGLILLLAAIPLTLALIEYAAFGPTVASGKLPPVKVLFLDLDDTLASRGVPQFFAGGPMKDMFELAPVENREAAKALFQSGAASALIVIPKGFQDSLLAGKKTELELDKNPIQTYAPEVVDSVLEMGAAIGNGLLSQARAPLDRIQALVSSGRNPTAEEFAVIAREFFTAGQRFQGLSALQNMSVEVQRPKGRKGGGFGTDPSQFFATMFPGLVLFGLFFLSQALAARLLRDRTRGLQRRLIMTPAEPAAVLGGGILYLVVALLVLLVLLGGIGALIFRIRLREPAGLLVLGLGFAVFVTGLQLAIAGMSRSDRGAQAVSGIATILLSLAGGTFFPADMMPAFLRSVAMVVPNGATQQGLMDILARERSLAEVGVRVATVWGWALVALAAAVFLERRKLRA